MAMNFHELTLTVRAAMIAALEDEEASGRPYQSKIMSPQGLEAYSSIIRASINSGTEVTLADDLADPRFWKEKNARGATVNPMAAAAALALTEFNTWYVAGLAAVLQNEGATHCEVYRADDPRGDRASCSAHEEQPYPLADVVAGHRIGYWPRNGTPVKGAFTVPAITNCHHTIRRLTA